MYIVIGASSFLGVYTVEQLISDNFEVIVTGRNNKNREFYENKGIQYINLDISNVEDFKALPTKNVDGVILFSGLLPANAKVNLDTDENAIDYISINTIGTLNVLEYCRKNNIKRLLSTTSYADVYNHWSKDKIITEDEPRSFSLSGDHAAYVISKNAATDMMLYYNQQHGMKNIIFRLPPVYGVGPHGSIYVNGVLKKSGLQIFIDKAEEGSPIEIHGDKELSRDVVYVKDVARAASLAMKNNESKGLYNMTSGVSVTLDNQVKTIIDVFSNGKKSEIVYREDIENNTPSFIFSMEKAKLDFGFTPKYSDFSKMMKDYKETQDRQQYYEVFRGDK